MILHIGICGKGKYGSLIFPVSRHHTVKVYTDVEVKIHTFRPREIWVSCQLHTQAEFVLEKDLPVHSGTA
jgi:hypothetical protein